MTCRLAFTLIELLVVIAVIAVLAAILFPVLAKAREKVRQTSCLSNSKQIATGISIYLQDYDETYPAATNISAGFNSQWPHLRSIVQPYVRSEGVWWCPSEPRPSTWESVVHPVAQFNDPAFKGAGTSYAFKSRSPMGGCAKGDFPNCRGNLAGVAMAAVEVPAQIWLFWDADSYYSRHTDQSHDGWDGSTCQWTGGVKGQIVAWADGHAKLQLSVPRPQWYENMALDGHNYTPISPGCP